MKPKLVLKEEYTNEKLMEMLMLNGYTIRSFAEKIGVSNGHLSEIFRGKISPGPKTAAIISQGFGLTVEQMFTISIEIEDGGCQSENSNIMVSNQ